MPLIQKNFIYDAQTRTWSLIKTSMFLRRRYNEETEDTVAQSPQPDHRLHKKNYTKLRHDVLHTHNI